MNTVLRVLLVEDNEKDAALLILALVKGGFEVKHERVETAEQMREQLRTCAWDVVISDYSLPTFSAIAALRTMHELGLDLPFIIVSGTIEEDAAVEAIRAGAHDFMSKGRFARLIPAIEREMREARVRAESAKMRQQLLISDRMASMGTLAAGVAHEINNPLTAVVAGVDLALEEMDALVPTLGQPALAHCLEYLKDAREAAERVRLIVRDLRTFSRSDDETMGPVDIERAIETSIRMVQHEVRHRATVITRYGNVPKVAGNEARLGQVFLNLVLNAAQAMPSTRAEHNEIVIVTSSSSDGRVCVEVRDNGPGIPAELQARIFDPFFTTKPIGTGTGLGLSICHRIVSESGGEIMVESAPKRGTVFRTWFLPYAQTASSKELAEPSFAPRDLRILVLDDEPVVGQLIARMFDQGHEVMTSSSPRQALTLMASGEHFDVVLCDLMMPEMTGMDVYDELLRWPAELRPRIAFMSGGVFTKAARDFVDRVPCPHLEKPFQRDALRKLLAQLFSG